MVPQTLDWIFYDQKGIKPLKTGVLDNRGGDEKVGLSDHMPVWFQFKLDEDSDVNRTDFRTGDVFFEKDIGRVLDGQIHGNSGMKVMDVRTVEEHLQMTLGLPPQDELRNESVALGQGE